jgi:hypothetical protein
MFARNALFVDSGEEEQDVVSGVVRLIVVVWGQFHAPAT